MARAKPRAVADLRLLESALLGNSTPVGGSSMPASSADADWRVVASALNDI